MLNSGDEAKQQQRALLALALLVSAPSVGTAAAMFWWPELMIGKFVFFRGKAWLVLLPLGWRLCVDREPLSWSPSRRGGFGVASASGVLISMAIFLAFAWASRVGAIYATKVAG